MQEELEVGNIGTHEIIYEHWEKIISAIEEMICLDIQLPLDLY